MPQPPIGMVSDLPGLGQRVVSDLSQDMDGLSRTWTDAGGRRQGCLKGALLPTG